MLYYQAAGFQYQGRNFFIKYETDTQRCSDKKTLRLGMMEASNMKILADVILSYEEYVSLFESMLVRLKFGDKGGYVVAIGEEGKTAEFADGCMTIEYPVDEGATADFHVPSGAMEKMMEAIRTFASGFDWPVSNRCVRGRLHRNRRVRF